MTTHYSLPGTNVLLMGATGTGKTHCLRTLVDAGLEVFVLFTEPGMEVLGDLPADKLHWHYLPPATVDWETLIGNSRKINQLSYEALAKQQGVNKEKYGQFVKVIAALADFPCDRTGKTFGPVDSWDSNRVIVIDSLSGLSTMSMDLCVGSKPTKSMPDWMMAQDNLLRLVDKLTNDTQAHFILTSHVEREPDEVTGGVQIMASTLGKKLAPKLPRNFSEVIYCRREGTEFFWSTASMNVDTKARHLPISDRIKPDFNQIISKWAEKGGKTVTENQSDSKANETTTET